MYQMCRVRRYFPPSNWFPSDLSKGFGILLKSIFKQDIKTTP